MITSQDKEHITRLIQQYAGNGSTEEMIAFVADNKGMLEVCDLIVTHNREGRQNTMTWIDERCYQDHVDVRGFLYEINQILSIFHPDQGADEYYTVLGLENGVGAEAIKQAYRKLSLRYHPDTATGAQSKETDAFVKITEAYHALMGIAKGEQVQKHSPVSSSHWRPQQRKGISRKRRQKIIIGASLFVGVMIVVIVIVSSDYRKRAMLAGLQQSRAAFIPPSTRTDEKEDTLTIAKLAAVRQELDSQQTTVGMHDQKKEGGEVVNSEPEDTHVPEPLSVPVAKELFDPSHGTPVARENGNKEPKRKQLLKQDIQIVPEQSAPDIVFVLPQEEKAPLSPSIQPSRAEKAQELFVEKQKIEAGHVAAGPFTNKRSPEKQVPSAEPKEPAMQSRQEAESSSIAVISQQETVRPSAAEVQAAIQKRIETFLAVYTQTYENKDLLAFTRFFDLRATENNKPLREILPTYAELFQQADTVSLSVSILKWKQIDNKIHLDGRFTIHICYKNSNTVQGKGVIRFLLADMQEQFSIQELNYHFDKH